MRNTLLATFMAVLGASAASAQTTPAVLRLTVDEAVKMALEHNIDLNVDRLDPQNQRHARRGGGGSVQANVQHQPAAKQSAAAAGQLPLPVATSSDVGTTNAGLAQRLPWFGTTYNVGWTATHTNSNSFLNSYNPLLQSGLSLGVSQPLIRDLKIDAARTQLATSRTQSRHRGHATARERGPHDGEREIGVLRVSSRRSRSSTRGRRRSTWRKSWCA